jgi:hypothetical protein
VLSLRLLISTAALLSIAPAFGEMPARVRGTITAIDEGSITVKERDGRIFALKTGGYTTYADVVPSSVSEIKVNDFVGSAVKGPPAAMVAVELAIVPESMRAGRIPYYGWDPLPDPTAQRTPATTATNMTNGLVSAVSPLDAGRVLTISYNGGSRSFRITVPPNAPIVRYVPAGRSALATGEVVMIKTNPGGRAGLVTIGKGVTPPM